MLGKSSKVKAGAVGAPASVAIRKYSGPMGEPSKSSRDADKSVEASDLDLFYVSSNATAVRVGT